MKTFTPFLSLAIAASALALTGCATSPETTQAIIAAHQSAPPTLQVKCPSGGCEITYNDPNRAQLKMPTNGWDALTSLGNNVTSVVPVLAVGAVAVHGFKALQNSGGVTTTTSTSVGANSGANSGNSGRVSGTTMTEAVSTPTVVTQPAPLIVTQPAPLVVR